MPPVVALVLALGAAGTAPAAAAAPLISVEPAVQVRETGLDAVEVVVRSRVPIARVTLSVLDAEGHVVGRVVRANVSAGTERLSWDDPAVRALAPGRYRIEVDARFADGSSEREEAALQLVAPLPAERPRGMAPPAIEYRPPGYRLDGTLERAWRDDRAGDRQVRESRLRVHWATDGPLAADATLDAYHRSELGTSLANSRAYVSAPWDGGDLRLVLRSALPSFDGPLRLAADYRIENDRRGIALRERAGPVSIVAFAADGRPVAGGRESVWAARTTMAVGERLRAGISAVMDDRRAASGPGADSRAVAADAVLDLGNGQRIAWQSAFARSRVAAGGGGPGHRLVWHYRAADGIALRAGVLRLTPGFGASLADPGERIERNATGPEAGIDLRLESREGVWRRLGIALNGFAYRASDGVPDRDQVDLLSQLEFAGGHRAALSARTRREGGHRDTRWRLSTAHLRGMLAGARSSIERSRTTAGLADRATVALRRGTPGRWWEPGVEWLRRHGAPSGAAPITEFALTLSGHHRWLDFRILARRTRGGTERGLNLFARFALARRWLHRYRGELWMELGDRATVRAAGRIAIGAGLRF